MDKKTVFKLLSFAGMALGFVGTLYRVQQQDL